LKLCHQGQATLVTGPRPRPQRRHLHLLGHVLVSVPYWEWGACKGQVEREQYLRLKARSADRHRHSDGYGDSRGQGRSREVLARGRSSRSRSRDQSGDGRDGGVRGGRAGERGYSRGGGVSPQAELSTQRYRDRDRDPGRVQVEARGRSRSADRHRHRDGNGQSGSFWGTRDRARSMSSDPQVAAGVACWQAPIQRNSQTRGAGPAVRNLNMSAPSYNSVHCKCTFH
jgi:hypothetical protein